MRALALMLFAAALAGCTAPSAPQLAQPAFAPAGLSEAPGVALPAMPQLELPAIDGVSAGPGDGHCAVESRRSEDRGVGHVTIRVEGCSLWAEPFLFGGFPRDPRAEVDVGPGAKAIDAQLHLHSGHHLVAALRDDIAGGHTRVRGEDTGGTSRDSLVRLHIDKPERGTWSLVGALDEISGPQTWTAILTVTY